MRLRAARLDDHAHFQVGREEGLGVPQFSFGAAQKRAEWARIMLDVCAKK